MDKFDPEFLEEQFHKGHRKEKKAEKKLLSEKDRSKFKKSDQDKIKPQENYTKLPLGVVLSITGEKIIVDVKGKEYFSSLKGSLKKEKGLYKNLITVGDFVRLNIENNEGQIFHVENRNSELTRIDKTGRKKQLIAANIEQAFITMSVVVPPFKPNLVDRFLISAKKGNIHPIIIINKCDLLESDNCTDKKKTLLRVF